MTAGTPTAKTLLQYGFLALPVAFAGFPLYVLVPDYYATHFNVPLSLLGIVLLVLRAGDAVLEPWLGSISDRLRGKASLTLPCAGLLLCASVYALFEQVIAPPVLALMIFMTIAVTAYSFLSINLASFGALWTTVPDVQTRIASAREAFGLVGLVVAVSLPSLFSSFMEAHNVYLAFSLILCALMIAALAVFSVWQRNHKSLSAADKTGGRHIRLVLGTMPLSIRRFLVAYGVSMLASSIPAVLVVFFVRDLLGAEAYTGVFLLLYFSTAAVCMPLWKNLSGRFGKHQAWLLATGLAILSFIWAFFLKEHDVLAYGLVCIFSGAALGADLVLPPSILADNIHESALQADVATHFSFFSLLAKLSLAFASAVALPLLDISGFVPAAENSSSALLVLSAAYALVPCMIKLVSALLIYRLILINSQHGAHREKSGPILPHTRSDYHA